MPVRRRDSLVIDNRFLPGRLRRFSGIGIPVDAIPGPRSAQEVEFAVAVEIGRDDRPGLTNFSIDIVPRPAAPVAGAPQVFEPVEAVAEAPAGSGHVEIAVAV